MLTVFTSPHHLEEKRYALHVLLGEMLGIPWNLTPEPGAKRHRLALPNGAELQLTDCFADLDAPEKWTFPNALPVQTLHPFVAGEQIAQVFGTANYTSSEREFHLELDLLASTFFMLTRLEESRPELYDEHGRFPARHSLAFRAGFLDRPVVNEWADFLYFLLRHLGWRQPRPERSYQMEFSCDVDHPKLWWSVGDRLKSLAGAWLKRRDSQGADYMLRRHFFRKQDPFDVFDAWFSLFDLWGIQAQFNFLGARPRSSNCWYPLRHPFVIDLLQRISERGHHIGFHPSYESYHDAALFRQELASLQQVSPMEVKGGRQHYLRFEAPRTWQMWQEAGLEFDSTLGYPDAEGFRCGICHDFPVFDTKKRVMLPLRERPLIAMDVTLALYRGYTPQQALEKLQQLRSRVEKHKGNFTLLWHNSSWNTAFWEPWKGVLNATLLNR